MTETETMSEVKRCRICMGAKPYQISLFRRNLGMKVMNLADVKVAEGDGLPSTICLDCEIDLEKCYEFRAQVQWSDKKFREDLSLCQVDVEEYNIKEEHCTLDTLTDAKHLKNDSDHENNDNIREDTSSSEQSDDEDNKNPLAHVVVEDRRVESDVEMSEDPLGQEEPLIETQIDETETSIDPLISVKDEAMAMETGSSINVMSTPSTSDRLEQKTMASGPDKNTPETSAPPVVRESVRAKFFSIWPRHFDKLEDKFGMKMLQQTQLNSLDVRKGQSTFENTGIFATNLPNMKSYENYNCQATELPMARAIPTSTTNSGLTATPARLPDFKIMNINQVQSIENNVSMQIPSFLTSQVNVTNNHKPKKIERLKKFTEGSFCLVCNVDCGNTELLQEHLERKDHICRVCTMGFGSHADLETHVVTHKLYLCKKCNDVFLCKSDLFQHQRKVSTCIIDKVRCEICGQTFSRKRVLSKHLLTHNMDEAIYKCIVCSKSFKLEGHLNSHLKKIHIPFEHIECTVCGSVLLGPASLKRHVLSTHIKPSGGICCTCGKIFANSKSLKTHQKNHDQSEKLCEVCGKSCKGESEMTIHMKSIHPKSGQFVCRHCNEPFKFQIQMRRHVSQVHRKRNYSSVFCEICGKEYKNVEILKKHKLNHSNEKRFKCKICGAAFKQSVTLWTHSRIHSSVGKYHCDNCGKSFRWKQTFVKHVQKCEATENEEDINNS